MIVVPFYIEIESDEQWTNVEKALSALRVCFVTSKPLEGVTIEEVEEKVIKIEKEMRDQKLQRSELKVRPNNNKD